MLQSINDKLKGSKFLAYVVLLPLILVFAAWGAYGVVQMDFSSTTDFAAKVDGHTIAKTEVSRAWGNQLADLQRRFGGELPEAEQKRLQENLLEGFVRNHLVSEQARERGYRVSRERVNEYIANFPAFQIEGKYSEARALTVLAENGISQDQFRDDAREDLQNRELQNSIALSNFVTPAEVQRRLALEDEQREVAVLTLPADKYAGAAPDDAALQAWLTSRAADFQTTESVRLSYAEIQLAQIAAKVLVTENDLKELYDSTKDRYVTPERRRAQHILIAAADADPAALKKAEALVAQLKTGADFAALAKTNSEDSQTAPNGGDLGWLEPSDGDITPELTKAVFALAPGAVSAPVKTRFGYHVAKLLEVQASAERTFEQARADLETEFRAAKASEQFGDLQENLAERVESGGKSLADLAKEFGLSTGVVESFARGSGGGLLGANAELDSVVFTPRALEQRRVGGPVPLGEDRLVIFKVEEHRKPTAKPLAEVRDAVQAAVLKERGTQAALTAAKTLLARLNQGESLESIAKSQGLKWEAPRFVGRADPSLPAQVRTAVFAGLRPNKGAVRDALALESGGAALYEVTRVRREPDASNQELNRQRINETSARTGAGDVAAYVAELRRLAKVEKSPQAFE